MTQQFFFDARDPENCIKHLQPLFKALSSQDPLPCVLLLGAYIDSCLKGILKKDFRKSPVTKNVLGMNGVLGGSYDRAQIAHCLELIDDTTLENIQIISKVRNLFAHSPKPLDFSHREIRELANQLRSGQRIQFPPYLLSDVYTAVDTHQEAVEAQEKFVRIALGTALIMIMTPEQIDANRKANQPEGT